MISQLVVDVFCSQILKCVRVKNGSRNKIVRMQSAIYEKDGLEFCSVQMCPRCDAKIAFDIEAAKSTARNQRNEIMTTAIHTSNFGQFCRSIPCDLDGYTHTTISGWLDAPMDHGTGRKPSKSNLRDWARDKARESREAIRAANNGICAWQSNDL
jgi:hypothetical protein